jgi:hypothetical protein
LLIFRTLRDAFEIIILPTLLIARDEWVANRIIQPISRGNAEIVDIGSRFIIIAEQRLFKLLGAIEERQFWGTYFKNCHFQLAETLFDGTIALGASES